MNMVLVISLLLLMLTVIYYSQILFDSNLFKQEETTF